jgi:uncharacterized ubiquitin-like protein YukD
MELLDKKILSFLTLLVFFSLSLNSFAQNQSKTIIKGVITDAKTGEPVPFASVSFKGTAVGGLTDKNGRYLVETNITAKTVSFSFIGYETQLHEIVPGKEQTLNIRLKLSVITLDEVVVSPKRRNYTNRNNPAVDLIKNVIANKGNNRKESYDYLAYQQYEKIQFALSNITEKFKKGSTFAKFRYIFENTDTTKRIGNAVLPVFIKETISENYFKSNPKSSKEVIIAEKTNNLYDHLDNKGVSGFLNNLYQNINIYDNSILFLTNKFLSPVAETAPAFYRYYVLDTMAVGDINCVKLFFEPRNKSDFLFHGNLYITMDSLYAIRKVDIGVNQNLNIDWVQDISITQDFEKVDNDGWLLSKEDILIDFGVVKNSLGLFGQRTVYYKDYIINDSVADVKINGPKQIERISVASDKPGYWETNRFVPLTRSESGTYTTIDSIKKIPAFNRSMAFVTFLTTGFIDFDHFDIGPFESFYSYNEVEGSRLRFGGRTTTDLSKRWTLDGYVAYGLKDKETKYNLGLTHSLTRHSIYEFPVKYFKVNIQKDTKIPGQELQFTQEDNVFLSLKRGLNDRLFLNNNFLAEYYNEYENHLSYSVGYSFTRQKPVGKLYFNTLDYAAAFNDVPSIDISEFRLSFRYAPNETFYQGKMYRYPYPSRSPVFELKVAAGSKSIGNDYDYVRLQADISKRLYISVIGYTDITFEAGKVIGKVPYPLLFMHRANQTYSYQENSYNLMNFIEFVSDEYVALNIDHCFNGFILNKVPLVKKLKLREMVTLKALYGGLTDMSNPALHSDLFKLPTDVNGLPVTYTLESKPYIEAGVGIANIFRIIRVDFVKRLSYNDHANISTSGFRLQFRFDI